MAQEVVIYSAGSAVPTTAVYVCTLCRKAVRYEYGKYFQTCSACNGIKWIKSQG